MASIRHQISSQLFTVRLWKEQIAEDRTETRGRVQHVLSGEVGAFRTWEALTEFMAARIHEVEEAESAMRGDDTNNHLEKDD